MCKLCRQLGPLEKGFVRKMVKVLEFFIMYWDIEIDFMEHPCQFLPISVITLTVWLV